MIDLTKLGWDDFFESQLSPSERLDAVVARIIEPARGLSRALCPFGEVWAEPKEIHGPAVGDWVVGTFRDAGGGEKRLSVERTLNRKSKLSRNAGNDRGFEQILCANTDVAFLMVALNQAFNARAVGRYLEIIRDSGILAVVVVSKTDTGDAKSLTHTLSEIAAGVPLHAVSVRENIGLEPLRDYFSGCKTIVLLGSSGAGKSTLVNCLCRNDAQGVGEAREGDEKGRHTTTGRRLIQLPFGGMVIDSPGIREIQAWREPAAASKSKGRPRPKQSARGRWTEDEDE